jgi:hypothetical protein
MSFTSFLLLTPDTETANAESRAEARDVSRFAFAKPDDRPEPPSARSAFGERFLFDQGATSSASLQPSQSSTRFDDRFFGDASVPTAAIRPDAINSAAAPTRAAAPRVAAAVPLPRRAPRSGVAQATPKRPSEGGFQLASASETSVPLAYASNDPKGSGISGSTLKELTPKDFDPSGDVDTTRTAIYDITSRTVYLPNGRRLEAHSGLGGQMDDPRYINAKNTGPTPPNVYDLKMREARFHGVRAIRLVPTDESKMFGRDGILAHSYLLGANGESNGCVSFKDYAAFLDAFDRGEVNRLVVVERLANAPSPKTAADWLSNTLKDMFRRS